MIAVKTIKSLIAFKLLEDIPDYNLRSAHKLLNIKEQQPFADIARRVIITKRTLLYYDRLYTLFQEIRNLKAIRHGRVNICEAGVYRGGSSRFIAMSCKALDVDATIYSVDTFSGHSDKDVHTDIDGGHRANDGFSDTSFADVSAYLSSCPNIRVLKGRIQEIAPTFDCRFDMAHLDMDIYEPTRYALDYFDKALSANGVIVVDDYGFTTCPGAKLAVDEFLLSHCGYVATYLLTGQMILQKVEYDALKPVTFA